MVIFSVLSTSATTTPLSRTILPPSSRMAPPRGPRVSYGALCRFRDDETAPAAATMPVSGGALRGARLDTAVDGRYDCGTQTRHNGSTVVCDTSAHGRPGPTGRH